MTIYFIINYPLKKYYHLQDITQQQIKKNNIVNRYLNLKSLPDNINYQSLVSMSYYENYKGQNPNSPGKNILNIGVQNSNFQRILIILDIMEKSLIN